jgi:thioredoxin reductase
VAKLTPPFPPGDYPVVVVGSGPGALQFAYSLGRLGVEAAVLSADDGPGGMFRHFPFFQRLITWTKPHAPVPRGTRGYEWYDWNSLLGEDEETRALVPRFMDGSSYFPSRPEMEQGLAAFTERSGLRVRYGCRWEGTKRQDDGFVLVTSDGEYRCRVAVFGVGMTIPWKPDIPGLEDVPHYVETRERQSYAGRRIVIIGKRNSGFELADGLLPWARQIILASPRPARLSVFTHSTAAARARYLQPYEDHLLGGGTFVLDAATERVERTADGYRVHLSGTTSPGGMILDADEVIAATGFTAPLGDLPDIGATTFFQDRLPAQTPFWESVSLPGAYFVGSITQGAIGLKKHGIPSNSAAVHGFRYNARILAGHVARSHFGIPAEQPVVARDRLVDHLLSEATSAPELWNQQSYLARVVNLDGVTDQGILPLAHFVDEEAGPDAVAIAVENTGQELRPAVYLRRQGRLEEHILPTDPMLDFRGGEHRTQLTGLLAGYIG